MSLHLKTEFALNELNKKNTFQNSKFVEFNEANHKFGLAFYGTTTPNVSGEHPFLVLLAWSKEGWVVLSKMLPLWNDNLMMDMGSEDADIRNYLWYIGQTFNKPFQQYLKKLGETNVAITNWEKILQRLESVEIKSNEIKFKEA